MPICEADPWRLQYFERVACPPGVNIPTEDSDAWLWYPDHRWVYDKIAIALSQGLDAGPHGVPPPCFPVFSKPIVNLKGMGIASRVLSSQAEYEASLTAGHMWMTLMEGRHVSTDAAVVDGEPRWWRHVTGEPGREGTFDHWTVHAARDGAIEDYCGAWIRRHHQHRDHRWAHHRSASAHERSVAGPLRRRLGRGTRAPLPRGTMGLRRCGPARRIQRGAV